ncbi:MAG TPA: hypothetical protein VJT15_03420 [Pyrinomonadaceae bacterium]|nr:hypothetical protein [Pyrinomonadaceae bacterium]
MSEAIARSDRGPLPKLKEMVKGLNVDNVTEEVSKALDRMNQELAQMSSEKKPAKREPWEGHHDLTRRRTKKTPEERREQHITSGIVSLFSGVGLTIFLYYLSAALVLKLPPEFVVKVPFEIDPVVRIIWALGLIPTLTGLGHIFAGLLVRPRPVPELEERPVSPPRDLTEGDATTKVSAPDSVTERTTNLLEHNY